MKQKNADVVDIDHSCVFVLNDNLFQSNSFLYFTHKKYLHLKIKLTKESSVYIINLLTGRKIPFSTPKL